MCLCATVVQLPDGDQIGVGEAWLVVRLDQSLSVLGDHGGEPVGHSGEGVVSVVHDGVVVVLGVDQLVVGVGPVEVVSLSCAEETLNFRLAGFLRKCLKQLENTLTIIYF